MNRVELIRHELHHPLPCRLDHPRTLAYPSPLADKPVFEWSGQWELIGWQNTLITVVLLAWTLARGMRVGYTPLRLASEGADTQVVSALRKRFLSKNS